MIASISKTSNYKTIIEYHLKKEREGNGRLLFDGTFSPDREFVKSFDGLFQLYAKENMRNKVAHIAISLPNDEKQSDFQFVSIANDYLKEMGYAECPYLIYRHTDSSHEHIHIVVSTIDYNGKKIPEFKDHYKSQLITRQLEKKYSLKTTEYNAESRGKTLTEINFRRFYMFQAIKKASKAHNSKAYIHSFLTHKEKESLLGKKELTQNQIQSVLGRDRFDSLYSYLQKNGYFVTLFKDELSKKLDSILSKSNTFNDFVKECNRQGVYVRRLIDKNQRPFFKYGMITEQFFTKDKNLSARFRYDQIKERFRLSDKDLHENTIVNDEIEKKHNKTLNNILMKTTNAPIDREFKNEKGNFSTEGLIEENAIYVHNNIIPSVASIMNKNHDDEELNLSGKSKKKKKGNSI